MSEPKKKRFVARVLDRKWVQRIAPSAWVQWGKTTEIYRGQGYKSGEKPPESGVLLVQSPYYDYYALTWGLAPNQDMPKWRWMYRARAEIRRGIDIKVALAVGRGLNIVCEEDKDVEGYANQLLNHLNIREMLQSAVSDMLIYGTAYLEKVRTTPAEEQEYEKEELAPIESRVEAAEIAGPELSRKWSSFDLDTEDPKEIKTRLEAWVKDVERMNSWMTEHKTDLDTDVRGKRERFHAMMRNTKKSRLNAAIQKQDRPEGAQARSSAFGPAEGELIELKPLDPLWMRINRDSFGNIIGLVQWGLTPIPQSIITEKIVLLRWMPKSWAHENAYGTSILMPIQRHVSLLIQAEEDMKIFWHQYAKPMLVGKGGSEAMPWPSPRLQAFQTQLTNRQTNTDAVIPGDATIEMLQSGMGKGTTQTFNFWAKHLREKIYEALGIPSILMNLPGEVTRATSDVTLQAFIADEEMLQGLVEETLMKQVLEPEVRLHFASKYPNGEIPLMKVTWPAILGEDRNKKLDRLIKATGVPFLTVNEARTEAGKPPMEGPPEDPEKYDKIPDAPAKGFGDSREMSASEAIGEREESLQQLDRGEVAAMVKREFAKKGL